jgi:hypothetical protein
MLERINTLSIPFYVDNIIGTKWLVMQNKPLRKEPPFGITVVVATFGVIIFFTAILFRLSQNINLLSIGPFLVITAPIIILCSSVVIYLLYIVFKWATMDAEHFNKWSDEKLSGGDGGNANLTCKNGHTCRVLVNFSAPAYGENYMYRITGNPYLKPNAPYVMPESCPECGAEWVVPHRHKPHMPLKDVSDLQRK